MNNTSKIKLTSIESLSKPVSLPREIVNPKRDWMILIILFIISILISIAFDFYMYQQIVSGDMYISVTRAELTIESLKSEDLKNTLNNFETKKANIVNLKLENLVDPSL